MTKEQFMEQVAERVRQVCVVPDVDIHSGIFVKNNDTARHGIVMKRRDEFISPTIYVDAFYEDFLRKKKTMQEIADEVMGLLKKATDHARQYGSLSIDFEDCMDKIIYRLVSAGRNKNYLRTVPHLPFLDLAIVFRIICRNSDEGLETIAITNELAAKWNTDTKELVRLAMENTPRLLPPSIDSLASVLARFIGLPIVKTEPVGLPEESGQPELPMFLLSNTAGVNGAAVMLYPDVIHQLACQYGSNLYILPSSIHETIVVLEQYAGTKEELSMMVRDINQKHVGKEEILSDTAYYYDREERKFT